MTQQELGKRVLDLRTALGISQMELSLRCEMLTASQIGYLEIGIGNPTYETLKKLARGLGITLQDLLKEDEPPVQYDKTMNQLIAYATPLTPQERKDLVSMAKIYHRSRKPAYTRKKKQTNE